MNKIMQRGDLCGVLNTLQLVRFSQEYSDIQQQPNKSLDQVYQTGIESYKDIEEYADMIDMLSQYETTHTDILNHHVDKLDFTLEAEEYLHQQSESLFDQLNQPLI